LSVVDGKERRKPIDSVKIACLMLDRDQKKLSYIRCSNKPGSVSRRAVTAIKYALKKPFPVRIFVYGEEDMLALPLFVMAPDGSVVIYGQPLKGMVIVKINKDIRQKAQDLIYKLTALG
jgi:GTP-dependent dephospho-CoA kinase